MPFIPATVFEDRVRKIREHLAEHDQEALIVTTPDMFYMVSGFHLDVAPWERPVAAVIPRDGEPFLVMNELSTNHLRYAAGRGSLAIPDYVIYQEHLTSLNRTWNVLQFGALLNDQLAHRGITSGRLAVEGSGPTGLGQANYAFEMIDVTPWLIAMREVKYPEELEQIRLCAELTDFGQDRYIEHAKPGRNVKAFDFEISQLIMDEGARRFPEDRFEVRLMSLSGAASASPHGTGADAGETFAEGDGVVNIIICRLNGLVVENERTLFIGEPRSDIQVRAFNAATAACDAAAAQMVAGNPVSSADAAAQRVIEEAGFGDGINHRTGHGIGIAGHEFPADMPFNHRPFREREVFSAEPGIYIWGVGGFRHDNTVIVGADAPEIVTQRSRKLEDQIVPV